jgi:radical SAM superfamily enzyme YgiQ (UPF0313 family)
VKLTIVHPSIGKIPGRKYITAWQMEPLPPAYIAGLTPNDVDITFFDDRLEPIDFDVPTDLVAISVETYTARRAYQIATEYRRRGVPVVMGGFHPTLVTEEVMDHAESVVVGEAEGLWEQLLKDFSRGEMKPVYRAARRPDITRTAPDRSIFRGKKYLPIGLVEAGRGCTFKCDFCVIQSYFASTQNRRGTPSIVEELRGLKDKRKLFFFVDDNIASHPDEAKAFYEQLIPLKIKWVSQATITMTHDEELLKILKASGCQGVLIGMETLDSRNLRLMNKSFNGNRGGAEEAVRRLHKHSMRLYATFIFGYDFDTEDTFRKTLQFCMDNKIFMAAFNHLTPFPGTPLYERLQKEGRLIYQKWWLDARYRYGNLPFETTFPPEKIQTECMKARAAFYSYRSILQRFFHRTNCGDLSMIYTYLFINLILHHDVHERYNYPLGDPAFEGELLPVSRSSSPAEGVGHALSNR